MIIIIINYKHYIYFFKYAYNFPMTEKDWRITIDFYTDNFDISTNVLWN